MGALDRRVCVITGGGRGIGREHALLFAREGAKVVVNDLGSSGDGSGADPSAAESVAGEIRAAGGEAVASTDSVSDWEGSRRIVDLALEAFGDLHVVVNNAGILRDRMVASMTEQEFDDVIAVHLKGTFNLTHWAAAHWRKQTAAGVMVARSIVNTSSSAGLHGNPGQVNYAAAKAGIAAITVVSAIELKRYGVKVNCIAPLARTRLTEGTPGVGEMFQDPRFDPHKISPLVAALATHGWAFSGQVFSVLGGSVGIYASWSIAQEIATNDEWSVDELMAAMEQLPRRVGVNSQIKKLSEAPT